MPPLTADGPGSGDLGARRSIGTSSFRWAPRATVRRAAGTIVPLTRATASRSS